MNNDSSPSSSSQFNSNFESKPETLLTSQKRQLLKASTTSLDLIFIGTFSPLGKGAMRGFIFALLAAAMGTGMFNLPFRMDQIGIIPYLIFVVVGALFSYIGMYLISKMILKKKVASYSDMCQKAYGNWLKKISEAILIIYPWGATICYQVIFAKFILQFLSDMFQIDFYQPGGRKTDTYNSTGDIVRICLNVGSILLNLIFILKKEIGILQKLSLVGVLGVLVNTIIILFTFLFGFTIAKCEVQHRYCEYAGIKGIDWSNLAWYRLSNNNDLSILVQAFASIIFCYVNHQLVFPLAKDLKNPSTKRLGKILKRVHITEMVTYILAGLSGYLLLAENTPVVPIAPMVMSSIQTIPMAIGKLLMVFALFFAVPLNLFPCRQVIYESFKFEKTNKSHIIISLIISFLGTVVAIVFQSVNSYFGLLGGTAGVMMCGSIPLLCYYKFFGIREWYHGVMAVFIIFVSVFGMIGGILSVVMM